MSELKIVEDHADEGSYDCRVHSVIYHYTVTSDEISLELLKHSGVSVHFLVPRKQEDLSELTAIKVVSMRDRAWHAGVSYWQSRESLNDTSVGIEIVNAGFGFVQPGGKILYYEEVNKRVQDKLETSLKQDKNLYHWLKEKKLLKAFLIDMLYGRIPPKDQAYYNKEISTELREKYKNYVNDIRITLPDPFINVKTEELYQLEKEGKIVWEEFSQKQIDTVIALSRYIIEKTTLKDNHITWYQVSPTAMTGHADVAPGRKQDPGPKFPWQYLAQHGIGAWSDEKDVLEIQHQLLQTHSFSHPHVDIIWLQDNLHRYGYDVKITGKFDLQTQYALIAFQMHFRPQKYDGIPDIESAVILSALMKKYFPHKYQLPVVTEKQV